MNYRLVSVILPIHNQADHVAEIVCRFEAALSGIRKPHELILVVNACRDQSPEICTALADVYSSIRVIQTDEAGWGVAVKLGLSNANGDLLCFTNSARTSPGDLAQLLIYAYANPDVVIKANRTIRDDWKRRLGSLLYNLECRFLFDLSGWDINGTPKVFPRTFEKLLQLTCDDDLIDAEFSAVVSRERYPMIEVPLGATPRHGGRSTTNYRSAWNMYVRAYRMAREMRKASR
jgi:glycosyltransferase involved in cell wall biosynthesis